MPFFRLGTVNPSTLAPEPTERLITHDGTQRSFNDSLGGNTTIRFTADGRKMVGNFGARPNPTLSPSTKVPSIKAPTRVTSAKIDRTLGNTEQSFPAIVDSPQDSGSFGRNQTDNIYSLQSNTRSDAPLDQSQLPYQKTISTGVNQGTTFGPTSHQGQANTISVDLHDEQRGQNPSHEAPPHIVGRGPSPTSTHREHLHCSCDDHCHVGRASGMLPHHTHSSHLEYHTPRLSPSLVPGSSPHFGQGTFGRLSPTGQPLLGPSQTASRSPNETAGTYPHLVTQSYEADQTSFLPGETSHPLPTSHRIKGRGPSPTSDYREHVHAPGEAHNLRHGKTQLSPDLLGTSHPFARMIASSKKGFEDDETGHFTSIEDEIQDQMKSRTQMSGHAGTKHSDLLNIESLQKYWNGNFLFNILSILAFSVVIATALSKNATELGLVDKPFTKLAFISPVITGLIILFLTVSCTGLLTLLFYLKTKFGSSKRLPFSKRIRLQS